MEELREMSETDCGDTTFLEKSRWLSDALKEGGKAYPKIFGLLLNTGHCQRRHCVHGGEPLKKDARMMKFHQWVQEHAAVHGQMSILNAVHPVLQKKNGVTTQIQV